MRALSRFVIFGVIAACPLLPGAVAQAQDPEWDSCIAAVKRVTRWSEEDTRIAARKYCDARKNRRNEQARLRANLAQLIVERIDDGRFDATIGPAVERAYSAERTCVEFEESLLLSHNVALIIAPETVAGHCAGLAADMVKSRVWNEVPPLVVDCATGRHHVIVRGQEGRWEYLAWDLENSAVGPSLRLGGGQLAGDAYRFTNGAFRYEVASAGLFSVAQLNVYQGNVRIQSAACQPTIPFSLLVEE